jgi:endonuclease-8
MSTTNSSTPLSKDSIGAKARGGRIARRGNARSIASPVGSWAIGAGAGGVQDIPVPEGDTIYRTARRLDAALRGQQLVRGELRHPRLVEHDLAGQGVAGVGSVGKHLFIRFDHGLSLHSHLRMDGSWQLYLPGQRWRHAGHHVRAVLATADRVAVGFRLHDMALLRTSEEHRLVGHLGTDLLDPSWGEAHSGEALRRLTADPAAELGRALLDQRVIAGVGNAYRCELCFLLGVSPWTPVGELADPARAITLARTLLRRNTGRVERSTTGELTRGRRTWVYERSGLPCRRCGALIRQADQGVGVEARVVYYCPSCQKPHPCP